MASVAVWIRLNELPIECYHAEALLQISKAIGNVLRVDTHTTSESRGRFARICVQVDVEKPLVTAILIGKREQPVCYEGIHKLCFECGRIGHRKDLCLYAFRQPSPSKGSLSVITLCPTERSATEGSLSLLKPAWAAVRNPWWTSMVELLKVEGMRSLDWALVPRITPLVGLAMWRILLLEEGQPIEVVIWIVWGLRVELKVLLPVDVGPSLKHSVIMNIIVWNCRGALKPSF